MFTSSTTARNAALDAYTARLNSGYIRLYSGAKPDSADVPATGELLAEFRFSSPAFAGAVGGTILANTIDPCVSARASGTAGYLRAFESDGTTVVFDGDVGLIGSGAFHEMNSIVVIEGGTVSISEMILSLPA